MALHEDRLFPADTEARKIARALHASVRDLPIISPHGHTQAAWFASNQPFPNPAQLFVTPDHYVYRMLYSQGVALDDLEIGARGSRRSSTRIRRSIFGQCNFRLTGRTSRPGIENIDTEKALNHTGRNQRMDAIHSADEVRRK